MKFIRLYVLAVLMCTWHALTETIRQQCEIHRMRRTALRFNRERTFVPLARAAWMCPSCGRVHRAIGVSPFTSLQFPGCCEFTGGHRLDARHATGLCR